MIHRKHDPEKISSLVDNFLNQEEFSSVIIEKTLRDNWAKIVGNRIAEMAEIIDVTPPLLKIKVESPTWRMELSHSKETLLEKINTLLKRSAIEEIKII